MTFGAADAPLRALEFFMFAFEKGVTMAKDLDYVPMPDLVIKMIEQIWPAAPPSQAPLVPPLAAGVFASA